MQGVPGAAIVGSPLALPDGVSLVRPAPAHRYALVEFAGGSAPAVVDLEDGAAPLAIEGALTRAGLAAFSPTGRSALLYEASGRLQIVTGLPSSPRVAREFNIPDAASVAVSDDGAAVLVADAAGSVSLLDQDGLATPLLQLTRLAAMSFLPHRLDAVFCDGARGEVILAGAGSRRLLASGLDGAARMAPSTGGEALYVTAAEARRAWRIDVATGESRAIDLPVNPDALEPLRAADTFLISSRPGEPAWLLTPGGPLFVPVVEGGAK
jgi:DNA-binding beta-propeller fold protein YncE